MATPNPFDQFDAQPTAAANPFDQFDTAMPAAAPVTPDTIRPASDRVSAPSMSMGEALMAANPLSPLMGFAMRAGYEAINPPELPEGAPPQRTWGEQFGSIPMRARARLGGGIAELLAADVQGSLDQAAKDRAGKEQLFRLLGIEPDAPDAASLAARADFERVRDEQLAIAKEAAGDINAFESATTPSFAQKAVGGAFDSVLASAPSLAVGLLTRNPTLAAATAYPTTTAQKFAELTNEGMDPTRALMHGRIQGVIESGTELLPAVELFKRGTPGWQRLLNFMAAELPGESVATLGQGLDDYIARLPGDVTAGDFVDGLMKAAEELPQTWATTLLAGGAQHGIVQAPQTLGDAIASRKPPALPELDAQQMDAILGRAAQGATLAPVAATMPPPPQAASVPPSSRAAVPEAAPAAETQPVSSPAVSPTPAALPPAGVPPVPPVSPVSEAPPAAPPSPVAAPSSPVPAVEPPASTTDAGTPAGGVTVRRALDEPSPQQRGMLGEHTPQAKASLVGLAENPQAATRNFNERSPTGSPATSDQGPTWTPLANGFAARQWVDVIDGKRYPKQQVRAPNGAIATRGLDTQGNPYSELEHGDLDELMSGEVARQFAAYFGTPAVTPPASVSQTPVSKPDTGPELMSQARPESTPQDVNLTTEEDQTGYGVEEGGELSDEEFTRLFGPGAVGRTASQAPEQSGREADGGTRADRPGRSSEGRAPARAGGTRTPASTGRLRIYRGSKRGTTQLTPEHFSEEALGRATGHPSSGLGVFFSSDPEDAGSYGQVAEHEVDLNNPRTYPSSELPELDTLQAYRALARQLQADGHDGIVIDFSDIGVPRKQYVAFQHGQVVSGTRYVPPETTEQPSETGEYDLSEEFDDDADIDLGIDMQQDVDEVRRAKRRTRKTRAGTPYTMRKGEVRAATDEIWTQSGLDPDQMELLPPQRRWQKAKEIIVKRFGFHDVVRDNDLQWGDAIDQLKDAFIGLTNMVSVLNVSPLVIGMDGKITLKQHKRGGGALAYFNPGTFDIGMTRRNDAFAHEWGHALDWNLVFQYAPELLTQETRGRGLTGKLRLGAEPKTLDDQVKQAWIGVLNAMYFDNAKAAAYVLDLEAKIAKAKTDKQREALEQQLDNFMKGKSRAKNITSSYYEQAKAIDKGQFEPGSGRDYWQRPTEMFARAFEAYIAHKIGGLPANHPFVTQTDKMYAENRVFDFAKAYPEEADRAPIFGAMDDLIHALRDRVLSTQNAPATIQPSDVPYWQKQAPLQPPASLASGRSIVAQLKADLAARREENARDDAAEKRRAERDQGLRDVKLNAAGRAGVTRWLWNQGHRVVNGTNALASGLAHSIRGVILSIESQHKGAKGIRQLREWFATKPGSGEFTGAKFESAVRTETRRLQNRFAAIIRNHTLNKLDDTQLRELRDVLVNAIPASQASPEIRAAAADLRRYMNDLYVYNQKHGVDIGYARNGYLPRVPDVVSIEEDVEGFRKAATELYSDVYDTEIGTTEQLMNNPARLKNLVQHVNEIAKTGNIPVNRANAKAAKPIVKEIRKVMRQIAEATEAGAETKELVKTMQALVDELRQHMKPIWASEAANDWEMRIRGMGPTRQFEFESRGPGGKYTKSRTLPEQADKIMGDFLINDPITLISTYTDQTVRRAQFGTFFGNPTKSRGLGWKLDDAMTALRQEYTAEDGSTQRVPEDDVEELSKSIDLMIGNYKVNMTKRGLRYKSKLTALATPVLLAKSLKSQLSEPLTVGIRSGDLTDGLRVFYSQMQDLAAWAGLKSAQARAEWRSEMAGYFGLVTDALTDEIMQSRYNLLYQSAKDSKKIARFFNVIGVHPHAMSMRRGAVDVFMTRYAPKMARRALGKGQKATWAQEALAEIGIPNSREAYEELARLPTVRSTQELEQMTYLPAIRTAITHFVDEAVADPKIVDKPRLATQPESSFMYGIMSFQYAFQRNVLNASARRIIRAWQADPRIGLAQTASSAAGLAMLSASQLSAWILGMVLFGDDEWEDIEKKISDEWLLQSISRAGLFGAADPIVNAWNGLKYQRDVSAIMAGPVPAMAFDVAQQTLNLFNDRNSPNNPNAEKRAMDSIWNVIAAYGMSVALRYAGANPYLNAALGMGLPLATSKRVSAPVSEFVAETATGQEYETKAEERRRAADDPFAAKKAAAKEKRELMKEMRGEMP